MSNLTRHTLFIICLAGLLCPVASNAQIDDVGLWLGASVNKKITREMEVSVAEQFRFNHDITDIEQVLSDAGVSYNFNKKFKAAFHYRFMNKNAETYYSKRHRLYLDLSYKEKFGIVSLTLRERVQEQYTNIYSSERGKIPTWVLRTKLSAKFDVDKKYAPYVSGELYYLFDDPREGDHVFTAYRTELGFVYEFNRIHSVNPYLLYQEEFSTKYGELIYGVSYDISF